MTCKCPTCDQPIETARLYISKDRTVAGNGNEIVRLTETEGEILHILARSQEPIDFNYIAARLPRKHSQKPMTYNCLRQFIFLLRSKIDALGIGIACTSHRHYQLVRA